MAEQPPEHDRDDRLDADQPFDAGQWALHGLLCVYYERERAGPEARVRAILERVGAAGSGAEFEREAAAAATPHDASPSAAHAAARPRILRFWRRRRWELGGGLAAAVILGVVAFMALDRWSVRSALADDVLNRAALQFIFSLPNLDPLLEDDPALLRRREEEIAAALARRDAHLAVIAGSENPADWDDSANGAIHAWQAVYYRLGDVGRWDEALREMHAALDYWVVELATRNPAHQPRRAWYWTLHYDLGNTYALLGDAAAARGAYQESIAARREYIQQIDNEPLERGVQVRAGWVTPLYWRLSDLALAEGDMSEARRWHAEADAALTAFFVAACRAAGVPPPDHPSALNAYLAAPLDFQRPRYPDSGPEYERWHAENVAKYGEFLPGPVFVIVLRAQVYREARLRRIAGDLDGAAALLAQAAAMPYYPVGDEQRLLYFEPLEAARVAIARGDYAAAQRHLADAEANAGAILVPGVPDHINSRPITGLPRAELELLRGVALLGQDPADPEGRRLVARALALPRRLAEKLPDAARRERFLRQFLTWDELAKAAR